MSIVRQLRTSFVICALLLVTILNVESQVQRRVNSTISALVDEQLAGSMALKRLSIELAVMRRTEKSLFIHTTDTERAEHYQAAWINQTVKMKELLTRALSDANRRFDERERDTLADWRVAVERYATGMSSLLKESTLRTSADIVRINYANRVNVDYLRPMQIDLPRMIEMRHATSSTFAQKIAQDQYDVRRFLQWVGIAAVAVLLMAGIYAGHQVRNPIEALTLQTEALARGEFHTAIPVDLAPPELQRIAQALERTRRLVAVAAQGSPIGL